ncbi:hypothetical protein BD324DRAFT_618210 [Kockovaella imperatae]|uniref:Dynamin-type G domain-containing protein n=1 Tax=Kockovaella imperatae TaxID=4999 RepID=A0A1Y1ULZ3_9TREE|nr:hypothetical protein BD324DRAFT_618210 [Kockovaella imperatae]ORX39012.1 hypothetical protein BD324DRAFT_618210 [Kockovaella imperatae]
MQPFHAPSRSAYTPSVQDDSTHVEKESQNGSEFASRLAREAADGVVRDYEEKRDRLDKAIEQSEYLVAGLKNFNRDQWPVRYPSLKPAEGSSSSGSARPTHRRTLTYADEPTKSVDVVIEHTPVSRQAVRRALTTVNSSTPASPSFPPVDASTNHSTASDDFSVLKLDLNLGATRHAKTLITHLEKSSISSLLDNRLSASLDHLSLLRKRIHDAQSRVLVTGDLNAGKSTLVNALLRRPEVMPTDQQPLTTRFVEVVSARENGDVEEIHVLDQGDKYEPSDKSTYTVQPIDKLEAIVSDEESDASSPPLRVFLRDHSEGLSNPSILHNGVVDISLIDAPGLNRDSIITTANFARQEEIDVVVFVVSAANHFTLSAKEFIWQAGHEKAHLFIVVNRFDQIKDKEKCRRIVLEQIKQLSPKTYEDAADLVHFVDSAKVALGINDEDGDEIDETFSYLEHSLRSFVLVNRAKSKLGPAQNYVTHLLADVELLASANVLVAKQEREAARNELSRVKPELETLNKSKDGLEENLVNEEERVTGEAASRSKQAIQRGLERISRGEMAAPAPHLELPPYPGLLGVWDYATEVKRVMLASLDFVVSLAESDARKLTTQGVDTIFDIGDKSLPLDVERSNRVFNPNAMFSTRIKPSRRNSGVAQVGLGLAKQPKLADVNLSDILDIQHHLFLARSTLPSQTPQSSDLVSFSPETSLGMASLAVGAFSLVGNKSGIRSLVENVVHVSELASNPSARKWIAPIIGVMAAGAVAYVIYELPRSIPRNVGRHLHATLSVTSGAEESDASLIPLPEAVSSRISGEVRKVMRIGAWDLRERFRKAVETRAEVVKSSEEADRKAGLALSQFEDVDKRIGAIREIMADLKV